MRTIFLLLSFLLLETTLYSQPERIETLQASLVTATTVTISWIAPTPSTSYSLVSNDVRMSTTPINTLNWDSKTRLDWLDSAVGTPGSTNTATITGLTTNTAYYFAIKTSDTSSSWSVASKLALGRTLNVAGTVSLGWKASPDEAAIGYRMYYGTNSADYNSTIDCGNVTSTFIGGLSTGTTYFFAVKALDANGFESIFSNEVSYSTPIDP